MISSTELVLQNIRNLSISELLTVQEIIIRELREKTVSLELTSELASAPSTPKVRFTAPKRKILIPGAYQPTVEEIEAELSEIFTEEERAEMAKVDLSDLPPLLAGAKTSAQLIIEDREDRFS